MTFRLSALSIVFVVIAGYVSTIGRAGADDHMVTATALVSANAVTVDDQPSYAYVGSKKCKKCHFKQYKSWAKTKMSHAFDILKPGEHKEAKEKFHVDVTKDFTKDAKCLKCHTVGFGKKGGYVTPDPTDKKAVRKAKKLMGVGCESCHGPGSAYIKVFEDILKTKRKYDPEELYAVGLNRIDETVCKTCHNEESPTINPGDSFDFEKRKAEGTHEHFPLKQRNK